MSDDFIADEKVGAEEKVPGAARRAAQDYSDWWRVSWVSSSAISVSAAIEAR